MTTRVAPRIAPTGIAIGLLLACLLGLLAHPGQSSGAQGPWELPAEAHWQQGVTASSPEVAVGRDGTAVLVWTQVFEHVWSGSDRNIFVVQARVRPPGGDWGPIETVSTTDAFATYPQAVVRDNGEMVVVWSYWKGQAGSPTIVQASVRPPGGSFGPVRQLSDPSKSAFHSDVAVAPGGEVHFVWVQSNGTRDVVKRMFLSVSNAIHRLHDVDLDLGDAAVPRIDIGANGIGGLIWQIDDVQANYSGRWPWDPLACRSVIMLASFNASDGGIPGYGYASRVHNLTGGRYATSNSLPEVAVSDSGVITAVWRKDSGQVVTGGRINLAASPVIQTKSIWFDGGAGKWVGSEIQDLDNNATVRDPRVAIGPDGTKSIAWASGKRNKDEQTEGGKVRVATQRPGQSFTFDTVYSGSDSVPKPPSVDFGGDGTTTIVWVRGTDRHVIESRTRRPGSGFESAIRLSSANGYAWDPYVALDRSGNATVAWAENEVRNVNGWRARTASTFSSLPLGVQLSGSGSGSVASNPAGIDCGSSCTARFTYTSQVTLVAWPDPGSTFAGWTGACASAPGITCTVTMSQAKNVGAIFEAVQEPKAAPVGPVRFALSVAKRGNGLGAVRSTEPGLDCGSTCRSVFEDGDTVKLEATPVAGSAFSHWSGSCSGSSSTCQVTVDETKIAVAHFVSSHSLAARIESPGLGSVESDRGALDCSSTTCRGDFDLGAEVMLSAVPSPGAVFTGWSGCGSMVDGRCVVSMDGPTEVTAQFVPGESFTVGFAGRGSGRVVSDPVGVDCPGGAGDSCENGFIAGSEVTLTAVPDEGSVFVGWVKGDPSDFTGGCSGTGMSCVSRVGLPVRVTARFELAPETDPEPEPELEPGSGDSSDRVAVDGCALPALQVSQLKRSGPGAATLKLKAPRAGVAVIAGAQVKKTRVKLNKPGWTRVKVKPTRKLANKLKRHKSVRTRVMVSYVTDDGCEPAPTRARVTFKP